MGVYIYLYAPIIINNNMSLVIQKFDSGGKTTQTRIYNRGNDKIDLDAYIRNAELEFSYWLADARLKDEEKQRARETFSKMILGINNGDVIYKPGGGFDNSIGITNDSKVDLYVAGFLGNTLRNMDIILNEENKEEDSSKTKYLGTLTIGNRFINQVLGENGNIQYLINQDPIIDGKRGQANRLKIVQDYINDIASGWDNYFTGYNEDLKNQWFKDYEKYGKIDLNDNRLLDENEYLGLSKLLGINDVENLFYTGLELTEKEDKKEKVSETNEETWRNTNYPKTTVDLMPSMPLTDSTRYGLWSMNALKNHLSKKDTKELLDLTNYALSGSANLLYLTPGIINYAGEGNNVVPFSNNFILKSLLEVLRGKNVLPSDSTGNLYYILHSYDKNRGTGLIYDITDGIGSIKEVSIYDIPWWVNKMHNEFVSLIPSNKEGGVLRKFLAGGIWYSNLTDYDPTKYKFNYDITKLVDGNMSDEEFSPYASSTAGKLLGRYTPTTGHGEMGVGKEHFTYTLGIENQQYYKNFGNALLNEDGTPTDVGVAWMKEVDKLLPVNSPARFYDELGNLRTSWTPTGLDAHGRPLKTYNSLPDYVNAIRNDLILGARHNVFLNTGNRYFYKDVDGKEHWVDPELIGNYTISEKPIRGQWNDDHTIYWNDYELTGPAKLKDLDDTVYENYFSINLPTNDNLKNLSDITPDLIGAGRLWASIHTNNNVYKTILPSLRPVLKNTYERYSPVTGDLGMLLFKNNQAASTLRLSYRPFTTDASLAANRMLEGLQYANYLQTQGYLADDKEIRETKLAALERVEDNMKRRSDTANFNLASINQTNRERASLEASRLKSNWQSYDNFLQGLETRTRARIEENQERANNFYDKIVATLAEKVYNDYMERANSAMYTWLNDPQNANKDITLWPEYETYVKLKREARERANSIIYSDLARRYNLLYNNPYENTNTLFFARGWNGRYGNN